MNHSTLKAADRILEACKEAGIDEPLISVTTEGDDPANAATITLFWSIPPGGWVEVEIEDNDESFLATIAGHAPQFNRCTPLYFDAASQIRREIDKIKSEVARKAEYEAKCKEQPDGK